MSNVLVVDSSIIVKWLNDTDELNLGKADKILAEAVKNDIDLITPELAKYEVGNVLLIRKKLTTQDVEVSLKALYAYPIQFITESEKLANETFKLADHLGITYYDASFLSLAKMYDATLITENIKHQGKDSNIRVVALKDY